MKLLRYLRLSNLRFGFKLMLLSLCIILCFALLVPFYITPKFGQVVEDETVKKLERLVDVPYSIALKHYKAYENGDQSEGEAKAKALDEIGALRYSGAEYFWVLDLESVMLMHPESPELIGTDVSYLQDVDGVRIVDQLIEKVKDKGFGVISYKWKRTGSDEESTKISYVKGFDKWDWAISTGIYADDVHAIQVAVANQMRNVLIPTIFVIFIIAQIFSYFISAPIRTLNKAAVSVASGDFDVDINTGSLDEIGDLSRTFDSIIRSIGHVNHEIKSLDDQFRAGKLLSRASTQNLEGQWKETLGGMNNVTDTLVRFVRDMPAIFMTIDKDFNIEYINNAGLGALNMTLDHVKGKKCYNLIKTGDCNTENCACGRAMREGSPANSETIAHPQNEDLHIAYEGNPLLDKSGNIIGAFEFVINQTEIKTTLAKTVKQTEYQTNEVNKLIDTLSDLSSGKLDVSISREDTDDDTKEIGENFERIYGSLGEVTHSIQSYINEITDILACMSAKDLNVYIDRDYLGDFNAMRTSINTILETYSTVLSEFASSALQVTAGANQVSTAAQDLSQGSTEQAGSIQEITATMSRIADKTQENAERAKRAHVLSSDVEATAQQGTNQMGSMLEAMDAINQASENISDIIKVIDAIAFQTNILALNAAVEAARAGEHGKGFAVVAGEVRDLAARSASAAKKTTDLIQNSMVKVRSGMEIAHETSSALSKIMTGTSDTAHILKEIADASHDQASQIHQINEGVNQISIVTQGNAANSEESAATSEEMTAQSEALSDMISAFQLLDKNTASNHHTKSLRLSMDVQKMGERVLTKEYGVESIALDDEDFGKY